MDPIAWSIGIAIVLIACAVSIVVAGHGRPTETTPDLAKALSTLLRAIFRRDPPEPPSAS